MAYTENDVKILESMLGTSVSGNAAFQVGVDINLPIDLPDKSIHYELYHDHFEFHIEPKNSNYKNLCSYLKEHLPNNEVAKVVERNFCDFAYALNKSVKDCEIVELGKAIIELRNIVEPVLIQYCEQVSENISLAREFAKYYEEQKAALPFHINVIDELHANENAHTRILTHLLQYKEDGKHVIMSSFLGLIPGINLDSFDIEKSKVYYNMEYIDGLIEKKGEYAIIIENKIHWAEDQNKQIERYVMTEIKRGIPADNIWVIYLTKDGTKKIEDYSLTEKAKSILKDRFIEMNYLHDILPWLKDTVLPNCRVKEEWLTSAIKQYIDHLEGLFMIRDSQRSIRLKMEDKIANQIGCTKEMSIGETYSKFHSYMHILNELQSIVGNTVNRYVKYATDKLQNDSIEVLKELCPDVEFRFYNGTQKGYFQVFLFKWTKQVHFEWIPLSEQQLLTGNKYTFVLHVEDNSIKKKFQEVLNNPDIQNDAKELGISYNQNENRLFYKITKDTTKSIADMTHTELIRFLQVMYDKVNAIQSFVSKHVLELQKS